MATRDIMPIMQRTLAWLLPVLLIYFPTSAQEKEPDRIPLKIAKDTTFFTEPVNEDGIIDYVAALNKHYGEGIESENNVFALMVQLLPPYKYEQQLLHNKNLYQILDITPKAEMPQHSLWRDYALATGLKEKQSDEMFDEAAAGPWTPEDYPLVSGWVDENGPALAALISGLSRDRYFSPLVWRNNGECAYETLLPHLGHQRWLGRLLAMRGLRAIAEGDIEWAIDHLIYLHRMGKGISHEPTMIGVLVGISIQHMQTWIVEPLVIRGKLSHESALRYLRERAKIGEINSITQSVFVTERSMVLDMIVRANAGMSARWDLLLDQDLGQGRRRENYNRELSMLARSTCFDVNQCLRHINAQFDAGREAALIEDFMKRNDALISFDERLDEQADIELYQDLLRIARNGVLPDRWTKERYTEGVALFYEKLAMPSYGVALRTQERGNARRLVEATAIALLGYRDQHGELPDSLDALVPTYFDKVPIDFVTGKPLVYRVNDDGSALIYSLGHNLKDDGGVDDYNDGDIAIRIGTGKP